ncbi:hypothetical protein C2845_PM15G14150 [Panicum miliaceum]|uniref:Uncharacterized protein n=1 Tax=Panicum miliaceum TaxID=4540 RepID=A0A3L6QAE1_PANMI|nr:hypothetical protein C2845_PM15G14150 [Panicum miliaceum]
MAPHGEARLVEDLRDFLDDFSFRAKRLAAPLLRPFGPSAEPGAVDDGELDKLRAKLRRIRATLRAAEDRVVADDFVALWLRELRDLEHAAEDVLEELEFEALRAARLEGFKAQLLRSCAGGGKRKREIGLMYSSSPDRLSRKIAKIMERYNEIARDRDALRLRSGDGERRQEVSPMTPTSCLMKCRLHGRERDMRRVTEMLLSDEASCCDVYSVVPIVGPAGVGKTSLAQHIYNDEAISSKFDIKMWVWVCQEFDVFKLSQKLAEEATESPCVFADINQMHRVITDRLKGKRFLLVLDDVWDESRDRWASLQVPLKCAARGSKIVVTTRSTKVAKMVALKMHQLGYLSDTNCWSVCRDAALRGRDPSIISESLVSIGKSVAARCKGIENVPSAQITPEASIKNKGELRKLILHWSSTDSMFSCDASSVLDSLQPHPDLEELTVKGFSGVRFPLWLGNQYMFSLSILELKDCRNCKELPSLGRLPCLKHLSINSLTSIKHVSRMVSAHDEINCGDYRSSISIAFPTLETLKFSNMDSWELWDELEVPDFPCLRHLTIMRCSKLSGLPNLQALQNLRIKNCENLLELPSFPSLQLETCKDVSFHAGHSEDVELVSCKPVWIQMGQPEEIEPVYID